MVDGQLNEKEDGRWKRGEGRRSGRVTIIRFDSIGHRCGTEKFAMVAHAGELLTACPFRAGLILFQLHGFFSTAPGLGGYGFILRYTITLNRTRMAADEERSQPLSHKRPHAAVDGAEDNGVYLLSASMAHPPKKHCGY